MSGLVLLIIRLGITIALFGFLFWALVTLWKDFRLRSLEVSQPYFPPISLALLGDEPPHVFAKASITIGRDTACELVITDSTISSRHTLITYHHAQWWVDDLHSTNGTFLNQQPIHEPVVLAEGDILSCGRVEIGVSIATRGYRKSNKDQAV